MPSEIHTIYFDKNKWTTTTARNWLKTHDQKPIKKVHITPNELRYRLVDPKKFSRFITKKTKDGINFVIGFI